MRALANLPPWLWVWAALYVMSLPFAWESLNTVATQAAAQWQLAEGLPNQTCAVPVLASGDPELDQRLAHIVQQSCTRAWIETRVNQVVLLLPNLPEQAPRLTLLLGFALVLLPFVRRWWVRRSLGLVPQPRPVSTTLEEIRAFIAAHAPGVEVSYGLARRGQYAVVYPVGYRRAGIAILGDLPRLWRTDREAAEAIVLHELAHCAAGDTLVVGGGSFLGDLIARWPLLCIACALVPLGVASTVRAVLSVIEVVGFDLEALDTLTLVLQNVVTNLLITLLSMATMLGLLLVETLNLILLPMVALWCAELAADRAALARLPEPGPLLRSIQTLSGRTSAWRWLLTHWSHPPVRLRQWMLEHAQRKIALAILLSLFPAAVLIKSGIAIAAQWLVFESMVVVGATPDWRPSTTGVWGTSPTWLITASLVLLWPLVCEGWERVRRHKPIRLAGYAAYLASASVATGASLLGLLLSTFDS